MLIRFLFFLLCMIFAAPAVWAQTAQTANSGQIVPADEQNETMRDTLKRMQIKREEEEHKKLLSKGIQIQEDSEFLVKHAINGRLPHSTEKRLKEIEKAAKHIGSEFGGSIDKPLESPPNNLADTLKRLTEVSERLNDGMAKTSRHIVSVTVVEETTEIIQLVKILRNYLN